MNDIGSVQTVVKEQLATNPVALIAGAFGLGFVLGGGLFTRLTARVTKMAFRAALMAALPVIQGGLLGGGRQQPHVEEEAVSG